MDLVSKIFRQGWLLALLWCPLFSIANGEPGAFPGNQNNGTTSEPLLPLPILTDLDPKRVALGKQLFNDPALSADNSMSCAGCHKLDQAGADGMTTSINIQGGLDEMNTPTVFNSAYLFRLSWNGNANSLESQIDDVMHDPKHMGNGWTIALRRLRADPIYRAMFKTIYNDGITATTATDAIANYERSLVTPNARFDRWLMGDKSALNEDEKAGYQLFKSYGCSACHQGASIGGNLFAKLGIFRDYFAQRDRLTRTDMGRLAVTGNTSDRYLFRVPSLRNIARTAPYLHDGSQKTLEDVIRIMSEYQLGRSIPDAETSLIAAFLQTLTGEYQGQPL